MSNVMPDGQMHNLSTSDDQTFVDLEDDIRRILSKPATGRTASAAILYVERFLRAARPSKIREAHSRLESAWIGKGIG